MKNKDLTTNTITAEPLVVVTPAEYSLTQQVHEMASALKSAKSGVRLLAIEAVAIGHQLGSLLSLAHGHLEQGAFAILCECCEGGKEEAASLIKLSKTYTLDEVRLRSGAQRQMLFAIGCVPDKEAREHEGDGEIAVSAGLGTATGHWRKYMREVENGRAVLNKPQARAQTRELYEWLRQLHTEGVE